MHKAKIHKTTHKTQDTSFMVRVFNSNWQVKTTQNQKQDRKKKNKQKYLSEDLMM